ncbi:hypothetical protein BH10CYA1_BH10CYA1_61260 [soil metagenome]
MNKKSLRAASTLMAIFAASLTFIPAIAQSCSNSTELFGRVRDLANCPNGQQNFSRPNIDNSFCPRFSASAPARLPRSFRSNDYFGEIAKDGALGKWLPERLPLKVFIADGKGVFGFRDGYTEEVENAFRTWGIASEGIVNFQRVSQPQQADILFSWSSRFEKNQGTEVGNTLTVTRPSSVSGLGILDQARIRMLTNFDNKSFSNEEIRKIALHEIGHALGIQGHSPDPNDIMYFTTSPQQQSSLTARDVNTFRRLYETPALSAFN